MFFQSRSTRMSFIMAKSKVSFRSQLTKNRSYIVSCFAMYIWANQTPIKNCIESSNAEYISILICTVLFSKSICTHLPSLAWIGPMQATNTSRSPS